MSDEEDDEHTRLIQPDTEPSIDPRRSHARLAALRTAIENGTDVKIINFTCLHHMSVDSQLIQQGKTSPQHAHQAIRLLRKRVGACHRLRCRSCHFLQ